MVSFWSSLSLTAGWSAPDPAPPEVPEIDPVRDGQRRAALAKAAAGGLLSAADLAAIFEISTARFHRLEKIQAFDFFRVHPAVGPRHYSGILVHRYLAGEVVTERTFGRKQLRSR
jgi:hypothetical protein